MKFNKADLTLGVVHALLSGLYNDDINSLNVDDADEIEKFHDIGRKVGMAAAAITEGLNEWLNEESQTDDDDTEGL